MVRPYRTVVEGLPTGACSIFPAPGAVIQQLHDDVCLNDCRQRIAENQRETDRKPLVGNFLRVGNDAIQPLEKSASEPLICNDRICGASGLRVLGAGRGERRRVRRERNEALNVLPGGLGSPKDSAAGLFGGGNVCLVTHTRKFSQPCYSDRQTGGRSNLEVMNYFINVSNILDIVGQYTSFAHMCYIRTSSL